MFYETEKNNHGLKYNPFKNVDLAKYRRNLVIKNLFENSYIDKNKYNKLIKSEIKLRKRKKTYLEDARYYVEDVRKYLVEKYLLSSHPLECRLAL